MTPVISTERLVLRGPVRTDAEAIYRLAGDFNVAGMLGRMPHPYRMEHAEAFLESVHARDWDREPEFAIEHRNFGLVGMIGFKAGTDAARPELGFWIGRPYWNRGYMTEAVRGVLKWTRRDWRKNVVEAAHFTDNAASGQVLCKAGFLYTGDVELRPCLARGMDVPARRMVWLA
ncbi:GNAT family N-acetyltransferase [Phenylobacterium sp.]|uniref:GNAT family N-acetyltransferase n=1 Tax=Phenylobacterium sp. TaxID=1871053 RepID=UPI002F92F32A